MALIDNISTILGFGGTKPQVREGASADTTSIHVSGGSQKADHSVLDVDGQTPVKYTDNLPK